MAWEFFTFNGQCPCIFLKRDLKDLSDEELKKCLCEAQDLEDHYLDICRDIWAIQNEREKAKKEK